MTNVVYPTQKLEYGIYKQNCIYDSCTLDLVTTIC